MDFADYQIWYANYGLTGNGDFGADYNRDGCVDQLDRSIWQAHFGMTECASRFQGDANGDGAVDAADDVIWEEQDGLGNCGGGFAMIAGGGDSPEAVRARLPKSADMNGDGILNKDDIPLLTEAVMKAIAGDEPVGAAESQTDSPPAFEPIQVLPTPPPTPVPSQEFAPE